MPERCAWCGRPAAHVHVHGHAQCAVCGTTVEPCCAGAPVCVGPGSSVWTGAGASTDESLAGRHAVIDGSGGRMVSA